MHTAFHFQGLNALMLPPPHRPTSVKTLRTQDTLDLRHFGTIRLVPKCPDSSAPVTLWHWYRTARPPANIFATIGHTEVRLLLSKRTTGLYKNTPPRTSDYTHGTIIDFLNYKSETRSKEISYNVNYLVKNNS